MSKSTLIILNLIVDHWMEIGDRGKVFEEHVKKGAVALLVPLCPVPMLSPLLVELRPKTRCMNTEFLVSNPAVVSSLILKLGTPSRIPPVTDGGGSRGHRKSVSEKYTAIVEIEMHV